jgi:hypothetical protein
MVKWVTVPVKLTEDEKKILNVIKEEYGANHNKTLRFSLEFFLRLMFSAEYTTRSSSPTLDKVKKISDKHAREMESEIKELLKTIPLEQQEKDYDQYSGGIVEIFARFDEIFVKNRKIGRKPKERKRGRPKDEGI